MGKLKINFKGRPDYACSTDRLRPIMNYIYFHKGNMVATDGHILVKIPLSLSGFEQYSEDLEGYLVHPKQYREIIKHPVIKISKGMITCVSEEYSVDYKLKTAYEIEGNGYPEYENVIGYKSADINRIGIDANKFNQISKCFHHGGALRMRFQERAGIHITPSAEDGQFGVLMPYILSEDL
jgi:hypothetical protein